MRLLFEIDTKDYNISGKGFVRPSARAIIVKAGLVAMVHSLKYDYYKFPGGGINDGESKIDALIRETKEETGLIVKPETIEEYGYVHRIEKSDTKEYDYFLQDNFYYICDVLDEICNQNLDDYEDLEHFTLEYVSPKKAIYVNRNINHGPKDQNMLEREAKVLEMLIKDGYL